MTVSNTRPLFWTALGSMTFLALSNIAVTASAEQCPPPITVTKTETSTVWADGSWPTKTITQIVPATYCPSSPRYNCFVVHTTTMAAQIPQATIHMVLPPTPESRKAGIKGNMDALGLESEGLNELIEQMESLGFEAEEFAAEGEEPDHPEAIVITDPVQALLPTPTRPDAGLPLPTPEFAGPACVNYKTETVTAPCPAITTMNLDKDGCAIITSTALVMTTATAVPENQYFGREEVDLTYTYTYAFHDEGETSKKRKHHHRTHPHKHHSTTTAAAAAIVASPTHSTVAPPAAHDVVVSPPLEVTKTSHTTFSTHVSYTLSFDFTYGMPSASPLPTPMPALPELPPPSPPTQTAAPPPAAPVPAPEPNVEPTPSDSAPPPTPSVTSTSGGAAADSGSTPAESSTTPDLIVSEDEEFVPAPASVDLTGIGSEDDPSSEIEDPSNISDPLLANEPHPEDPAVVSVVDDPPAQDPPTSTDQKTKACQACAEPCLVELDIVAKAETPLLQKLFENRIQKVIESLKITLQNEITLPSALPTKTAPMSPSSAENGQSMGLFARLQVDAQTSDLFLKTVEDRCAKLEAEYKEKLPSRCKQVVHQDCDTGDCLQREVDKAVQLLDVMLSSELAKDASRLRTEIIVDFKKKCDDHNIKVEKRGLLGGLLGDKLGGALDKTVESLAGGVDEAVVKPLTGQSLVQSLVDGLADSVNTVVDSFVRNCNRKGLLDFDTETGVGTLAAISSVSLDLFKLVCVKANADVKADV
ncbi:hypothetical protein EMPS_11509 [Entomortierella parvispora]|uniref:Uncharacterized protein n=1 Tax=Entomortierella parvispora TaxID=205924 RepID=A0A9P3M2S3_9FUNG|nr:hypothetical protein EMPS_11509 [Entomortierella parvispora]